MKHLAWRILLSTTVWVALGSALGSLARYGVQLSLATTGDPMPLGTLTVNTLGSVLIGGFAAWQWPQGHLLASIQARQFMMTGFCGGFTTFSVFSLETLFLLEHQLWAAATVNIALTVSLCLAGVCLGYYAVASRTSKD